MIPEFTSDPKYAPWPFWVLELGPEASSQEIEKSAGEISAKIKFGAALADEFVTPMGRLKRDEFLVREAKARLHDPKSRLLAEFWYLEPHSGENPIKGGVRISVASWYRGFGVKMWAE